jgi:hypothetical protein
VEGKSLQDTSLSSTTQPIPSQTSTSQPCPCSSQATARQTPVREEDITGPRVPCRHLRNTQANLSSRISLHSRKDGACSKNILDPTRRNKRIAGSTIVTRGARNETAPAETGCGADADIYRYRDIVKQRSVYWARGLDAQGLSTMKRARWKLGQLLGG